MDVKKIVLFFVFLAIVSCATIKITAEELNGSLLVSKTNFLEFPFYKEGDELTSIPVGAKCTGEECNELSISNRLYYRAVLLDNENYKGFLPGVWSGGDCNNDRWSMDDNGKFESYYPTDDGEYKWSGKYYFNSAIYIEDGVDSQGGKEWNEARLYYVPATRVLIYKGTKGFESFNADGSINYTHYKGPDYYYFRRCD